MREEHRRLDQHVFAWLCPSYFRGISFRIRTVHRLFESIFSQACMKFPKTRHRFNIFNNGLQICWRSMGTNEREIIWKLIYDYHPMKKLSCYIENTTNIYTKLQKYLKEQAIARYLKSSISKKISLDCAKNSRKWKITKKPTWNICTAKLNRWFATGKLIDRAEMYEH